MVALAIGWPLWPHRAVFACLLLAFGLVAWTSPLRAQGRAGEEETKKAYLYAAINDVRLIWNADKGEEGRGDGEIYMLTMVSWPSAVEGPDPQRKTFGPLGPNGKFPAGTIVEEPPGSGKYTVRPATVSTLFSKCYFNQADCPVATSVKVDIYLWEDDNNTDVKAYTKLILGALLEAADLSSAGGAAATFGELVENAIGAIVNLFTYSADDPVGRYTGTVSFPDPCSQAFITNTELPLDNLTAALWKHSEAIDSTGKYFKDYGIEPPDKIGSLTFHLSGGSNPDKFSSITPNYLIPPPDSNRFWRIHRLDIGQPNECQIVGSLDLKSSLPADSMYVNFGMFLDTDDDTTTGAPAVPAKGAEYQISLPLTDSDAVVPVLLHYDTGSNSFVPVAGGIVSHQIDTDRSTIFLSTDLASIGSPTDSVAAWAVSQSSHGTFVAPPNARQRSPKISLSTGYSGIPATVSDTYPTPGALDVPRTDSLVISFTKRMNQSAVQSAFAISPPIAGTSSWRGNDLIFDPTGSLSQRTVYTVTIGASALDCNATALDGDANLAPGDPYVWSFTTLPLPLTATDNLGNQKDRSAEGEFLYTTGSAFPTSTNVNVYVIRSVDGVLQNGAALVDQTDDGVNAATTSAGGVLPVTSLGRVLAAGEYNIVVDVDRNGTYSASVDRVDRAGIGLNIVAAAVSPTPVHFDEWGFLQDTFPFNEGISPGTAAFDTVTALMKQGINLARDFAGRGVIPGDSLVCTAPYTEGPQLDLVFRILPGPGSYSVKGNRASSLVERDPAHPFWASYRSSNGAHGTPGGHGGTWNPNVWNSARMDSAEANLSPLVSRGLGLPVTDLWQGTLHELDPRFTTLGISHDVCFLVNPAGPADHTNICCSAARCAGVPWVTSYPPAGYAPSTPTTTREGTKILPDGYFTPGTHIEYFVRRSLAAAPSTNVLLTYDTTGVYTQNDGRSAEGERWQHADVLPDLWKDSRFGGSGLACMLVVDAADPEGEQRAVEGALDSLGYGGNNGASRGWKDGVGPVAANLGQAGLAFDWYDIQAVGSGHGGHPGSRLASVTEPEQFPGMLIGRQSRAGPTPTMLETYYNSVVWIEGSGTQGIHDGQTAGMQANDVGLLRDFVATASPSSPRALWIAGGDAAEALGTALSNPEAQVLLHNDLGAVLDGTSYLTFSAVTVNPAIFDPTGAAIHPSRQYGIANDGTGNYDVLHANPAATGAQLVARYEDSSYRGQGLAGPFGASVYYPTAPPLRYARTLLDGFPPHVLLGGGAADGQTDIGRQAWIDDVLAAFGLCARRGPVIAVGDVPGQRAQAPGRVANAYPNPLAGGSGTIDFDLPRAADVVVQFYDVAGRLVDQHRLEGKAGPNRFLWNGTSTREVRLAPGVYYFRVAVAGMEIENARQRVVLLKAGR